MSNKQGGRGNRNEVMRCVVAEVEVDEVAAAEQGGCKYGGYEDRWFREVDGDRRKDGKVRSMYVDRRTSMYE
eukprot:scaffold6778_cov97-Skeletonema_dohrnii-CCMP3373.AAC.2